MSVLFIVISLVTLLFVIASKSLDLNDKHKWMLTIGKFVISCLALKLFSIIFEVLSNDVIVLEEYGSW